MERVSGGFAVGDFDRDGFSDLYLETGDLGNNQLFKNMGDGRFEDVTAGSGLGLPGHSGSGPLFFDYDGDGNVDLFVGGIEGHDSKLFRNLGDGAFSDVTAHSGFTYLGDSGGATAADYDGDGWLDLFVSHWGVIAAGCHLWRNRVGLGFECAEDEAGLGRLATGGEDQTFTANFVDIDGDRDPDLLLTSDFGTSSTWRNQGDGTFVEILDWLPDDENGMGAAVGDYDADGDFDWFVTGIFDGDGVSEGLWGRSGNRMYRNQGDGRFEDATDEAGVREGGWGWAACFADLDNDGLLDLVHVNGWPQGSAQFRDTPARLFHATAPGRFRSRAAELGFEARGDGRGVACFDYDQDGDVDLLVSNLEGPVQLWRNDVLSGHWLQVTLAGEAPNYQGIGAVVEARVDHTWLRVPIRAGSNYVSQDPPEAHFGLGHHDFVDDLRVRWPDGRVTVVGRTEANRRLLVRRPSDTQPSKVGCGTD